MPYGWGKVTILCYRVAILNIFRTKSIFLPFFLTRQVNFHYLQLGEILRTK